MALWAMIGGCGPDRLILLILFLLVLQVDSFNINILEDRLPGYVVFNASLGYNWTYQAFNHHRLSTNYLALDSYSGVLFLSRKIDCSQLEVNPLKFIIVAKKANLKVKSRFRVYVEGGVCSYQNHIHSHRGFIQFPNVDTIDIEATIDDSFCMEQKTFAINLKEFLPLTGIENCKPQYNLSDESVFSIDDAKSGILSIRELRCWEPGSVKTYMHSKSSCELPDLVVTVNVQVTNPVIYSQLVRSRRAANTPPEFTQRQYSLSVPENQNAGFIVQTMTANDPDSGLQGMLRYSLVATGDVRSQAMFAIDQISGQIRTTQVLDRESIDVHDFLIYAQDQSAQPRTAQAAVKIFVDDMNDHSPVFESNVYSRNIAESISPGSTVFTIRAVDGDTGDNADITYTLLNPTGVNAAFRVDPDIGSIVTRNELDRERVQTYTLRVQAADNAPPAERLTATAIVEITIMDENDNVPQFTRSSYTFNVSEDIDPSGQPVIAEIHATDADASPNNIIRYSIIGGNSDRVFAMDAISGQLSLLAPVDYEATPRGFQLTVRAQDGGSPPKSNSTYVWIRLIDVNDNAPRFYANQYYEVVAEDIQIGYNILMVNAHDPDSGENGRVAFRIEDAPSDNAIAIDATSGQITSRKLLNREVTARYSFRVIAIDHGSPALSSTAAVEIVLRDINDNSPVFQPDVYHVVVSEEDPPGKPVVNVMATDADENERLAYSITAGNTQGAFNIMTQMGTGLITVGRTLNYREQSRYILTVTATDSGYRIDTATVYINVSDANTHRPVFLNTPYNARVSEDQPVGATVITVAARDDDVGQNAQITYSMGASDVFNINPTTGDITIRRALDRETLAAYTLSVTATDGGRPPLSDTVDVEIVVTDVNDVSPVFSAPSYSGQVSEDSPLGTSVLAIVASDDDEGLNGRLRYTFDGGYDGDGDFTLDPTSGVLRTRRLLDRERVGHYELTAFAVDRGTPARSTSVVVRIEIQDVNDNAPQFEASKLHLYIDENSPVGSTVQAVQATDPDAGANAVVGYAIIGGADAAAFSLQIRAQEGVAVLVTAIELNYEGAQRDYEVSLRASSGHLISDVELVIHVQDVNDNKPIFADFSIIINNFLDHFPSGVFGTIPATDPDVTDQLRYSIISGNSAGLIQLDRATGELRLDARLNSDVPYNMSMLVEVTDGINEARAWARLQVRLVTEDMLYNSITVRLSGLGAQQFLSPLYSNFTQALCAVVPTTEENVFIVNVQDDTDSPNLQVVNVSFSVRMRVDGARDVFYSQQFLRERVYTQRALLTQLSTLTVLPFDDNLCLVEPCLNFEQCVSVLRFGQAAPVISSNTMLFRPIHPVNGFDCRCPQGFAGMLQEQMCDTEVNLCYSDPCGENGACEQREGGYTCHCKPEFTGDQCEVPLTAHYDDCPADLCRVGSLCTPLIRGGFRCEMCTAGAGSAASGVTCQDCADLAHHTEFCQLRTRSFRRGDFLVFPSLNSRHRFTVTLSFVTREREGLLFYNGRYNEKHDLVALEVSGGQVTFSFSLGSEVVTVRPQVEGGVSDGRWRQVTVEYHNRTAVVSVGESCDTRLSLLHGRSMDPPYLCADSATHVLEPSCAADITETCHRLLDLTGPFQLGGVPHLPNTDFQMQNRAFAGCLRDVYVDGELLDLNDSTWDNNTEPGCVALEPACQSQPCRNGGTCVEAWGGFRCLCAAGWGGRSCTQQTSAVTWWLDGNGALQYGEGPQVTLSWYAAMAFRTRAENGLLMDVELGGDHHVRIELVGGLLHVFADAEVAILEEAEVADGEWHWLQTQWLAGGQLIISLDYGATQRAFHGLGLFLVGERIQRVLVGGQRQGNDLIVNGLAGCVKDVRVGNGENARLDNPSTVRATQGCPDTDVCESSPCRNGAVCKASWQHYTCQCPPGRFGADCQFVCDSFNPCAPDSHCVTDNSATNKYRCECGVGWSGRYCEIEEAVTCPATWWGAELCGPCNCERDKGFHPSCDKMTGECSCKDYHYQPEGSDRCLPCDCYSVGTQDASQSCHPRTGQCPCHSSVLGRRCDSCASKFGEVTVKGCEVKNDECPQQFAGGMWWAGVDVGATRWQPCPGADTTGNASRTCGERGWTEPDMFNCTSGAWQDLARKMEQLRTGTLTINTFVAKQLARDLATATAATESELYGSDVMIASHVIQALLKYENEQSGLNLTHTQDRTFIQNVVSAVSTVTAPGLEAEWREVARRRPEVGVAMLLELLEEYVNTLAVNLHQLFTPPFDVVADNLYHSLSLFIYKIYTLTVNLHHLFTPQFDVVADNLLLGLDTIDKGNLSDVAIPKYNNKVVPTDLFDHTTQSRLPAGKLFTPVSPEQADENEILSEGRPVVAVGYLLFRALGDLLGHEHTSSIDIPSKVPVSINTPVMTLTVVDRGQTVRTDQAAPIQLRMRLDTTENRTSPYCVYWEHSPEGGKWSEKGCHVVSESVEGGEPLVTCSCNHMTSFAVLMAVWTGTLPGTDPLPVHVITYLGLACACACFFAAMLVFCLLRGIDSNQNSIRLNLCFCLFLANLIYVCGINATHPALGCKFVAILLHFFYLCALGWLFVDGLHVYRMLHEIRNIDRGAMKFYYVLGYVIPGITVCLAVGLETEGYGENRLYCWVGMDVLLLWSVAAPAAAALCLTALVQGLAARALCSADRPRIEPEHGYRRHALVIGGALTALLAGSVLFGLLALRVSSQLVFHYLFALLTAAQGALLVLGHVVLSQQTRHDLKYTVQKLQGKKVLEDTLTGGGGAGSTSGPRSRSALSYAHDSSLEGGLRASAIGKSTTTSTSSASQRAESRASRAVRKERTGGDSDSDSEISAMDHPDFDLASSHSSDEEDEMGFPPWGHRSAKPGTSAQAPAVSKTRPVATVLPSTSQTTVASSHHPHHHPHHHGHHAHTEEPPPPLPHPLHQSHPEEAATLPEDDEGIEPACGPAYHKLSSGQSPGSPKRSVKWAGEHSHHVPHPDQSHQHLSQSGQLALDFINQSNHSPRDHVIHSDQSPRSTDLIKLQLTDVSYPRKPLYSGSVGTPGSPRQNPDTPRQSAPSTPRHKLAQMSPAHAPASPRDRIILQSQHGSSMTSESEYV